MPEETLAPKFCNTRVIITRNTSGFGHTVTCDPPDIIVLKPNAVINYQLVDPTPPEIEFTGLTFRKPHPERQLSDPSISVDKRMITFSDLNSVNEVIDISLQWRDQLKKENISHDPQIGNDPNG